MPLALMIVGLAITVIGVVLVLTASFERPATAAGAGAIDVKALLEAFNKLLDKIEQRYRIGVIVMAVGLALVGIGAYLEANDAKDEAKQKTAAAAPASRPL